MAGVGLLYGVDLRMSEGLTSQLDEVFPVVYRSSDTLFPRAWDDWRVHDNSSVDRHDERRPLGAAFMEFKASNSASPGERRNREAGG
jgi:hypothetical protein